MNTPGSTLDTAFGDIALMIASARQRAYQSVNAELITLYWRIGRHISEKLESSEWGEGVVEQLAKYLARTQPGLRGFTRRNLFRMRQFHDAWPDEAIVSALLTQIPWTHNLLVLGQCRTPEERGFYLRLAIRERWSSRELERQCRAGLFERSLNRPACASKTLRQRQPDAIDAFKDAYVFEFLDLSPGHGEAELHRGLLFRLRDFLIELGRDFCFIGSEYPLQVGGRDFFLDLLFFHRGLNCLVAIELKVGRFEPEYLGKLDFYWRLWTGMNASLTSSPPSVCCCVPARMMRWWSTPSTVPCLRRWWPSIELSCRIRSCCSASSRSFMHSIHGTDP